MSARVIAATSCFMRWLSTVSAVRWAIMRGMIGGTTRAGTSASMARDAWTVQPAARGSEDEEAGDARRDLARLEVVRFLRNAGDVTLAPVRCEGHFGGGPEGDAGNLHGCERDAVGAALSLYHALDARQR